MKFTQKNILLGLNILLVVAVNYYWFIMLHADTKPIMVVDFVVGLNYSMIYLVGKKIPLTTELFIGANYIFIILAVAFIHALLTSN